MRPDLAVVGVFERLFTGSYRVRLQGGAEEPLYLPPSVQDHGEIRYVYDYPSSALHEIAHWCLAGEERRKQIDYGYWYVPPPRSSEQQKALYRVESRVQALEKIFSDASGIRFHLSTDVITSDTTSGAQADSQDFAEQVARQVVQFARTGLPERAAAMCEALEDLRVSSRASPDD